MFRKELLEAASKRLGVSIPPNVLKVARRGGFVKPNPNRFLGWVSYPPKAVAELVAYCKDHSRSIARHLGAKGGAR
jgi:hypothetical protein